MWAKAYQVKSGADKGMCKSKVFSFEKHYPFDKCSWFVYKIP